MVREERMLCRHGSVTANEHNGLDPENNKTSRLSGWFCLGIQDGLVGMISDNQNSRLTTIRIPGI
jgi:hypothetical protein